MESTLEAIQFFTNSANSVRVFEALTDGQTTSRALAEQTGASRSTVARILDEGESRGWIDSEGSQYELTSIGAIMIEEFRAYLQTVEGIQSLGAAIHWLPPPAHELDYRHLRDAEIVTPTPENPAEPFDRLLALREAADEYRVLTSTAVPRFTKALRDDFVQGRIDPEGVIEGSFIETLRTDPERVPPWHDIAERVWIYDGHVPIVLHILDETVAIWLGEMDEDERVVRGLLVTENPSVLSWADSFYEEYRTEAERLDPTMLPTR